MEGGQLAVHGRRAEAERNALEHAGQRIAPSRAAKPVGRQIVSQNSAQPRHALVLGRAGDDGGVDRTDGNARHPVGADAGLVQALVHPGLVGPSGRRRPAAPGRPCQDCAPPESRRRGPGCRRRPGRSWTCGADCRYRPGRPGACGTGVPCSCGTQGLTCPVPAARPRRRGTDISRTLGRRLFPRSAATRPSRDCALAHGHAFPHQLLAARVDQVDVQRTLRVLIDGVAPAIAGPAAIEAAAIAVIRTDTAAPATWVFCCSLPLKLISRSGSAVL